MQHIRKGEGSMRAKDLSNEELASILRCLCATGICPSRDEKEYLQEAADRLEEGGQEHGNVLHRVSSRGDILHNSGTDRGGA